MKKLPAIDDQITAGDLCECEFTPKTNAKASKDENNPWGENAVRALEDQ